MSAEHTENLADACAFEQLTEVLRGECRVRLDDGSSKLLRILLEGTRTDALITSGTFAVHFAPQKRRKPSTYFRRLGPGVISALLERGGVGQVEEPLVIGLPAGEVPRIATFPEWSYGSKRVWLVPDKEAVRLVVQASPEQLSVPFAQNIPPGGALSLPPELPEWAPSPVVYKELDAPRPCPSCGVCSARYRMVERALVCHHCGRSFEDAT